MNSLFNILMGRALLSNYSLGFLAFWFYPIIVVPFNQDHYHLGIPFYIYLVAIGFSIPFDMYRECLNFMVSVVRKQGAMCGCDRNTNFVIHCLATPYHIFICGYYSSFICLIVCDIMMVAAGCIAYPKHLKSALLLCFKKFPKKFTIYGFFPLITNTKW